MKKSILTCLIAAFASVVMADPEVVARGSFSASGDNGSVVIPAYNGQIVCNSFVATLETNQNLNVYQARYKTTADADVANSQTVSFYVDGSNTIGALTIAPTADHLIVFNSTTGGTQFRTLTAAGGHNSTNNIQEFTVDSNVTCLAGDKFYIIDNSDDVINIPLTTNSDQLQYRHLFTGLKDMPVRVELNAGAGANSVISGTYDIER